MLKKLIKQIVRRQTWQTKKKTIRQVLAPRCRRDGMPEYGRFTSWDIDRIIRHAKSNSEELMPFFKDCDRIGNYLLEYAGLLDLGIYRALITEGTDPAYAMHLIGDMLWQARVNANGSIPIIDPLRVKLSELKAKDPMDFLGRCLRDGMKFPYSEPGYSAELYRGKDVYCINFSTCMVCDFYRQFGNEEMTLFRKSWCTYDYAVAQQIVEGGSYERTHTLSDGDDVCDMRWSVNAQRKRSC